MTLQFPIPQFIGEAVRYQGSSWVWDGVGWVIDTTADRIDLATVPAYLGQFVYRMPSVPPLPTFVSLSDPDIFGATFILSAVAPFEGIKVYKNGELLVMDGGAGGPGQYVVNRAANRIEFLPPGLVVQDVITVGVLTPSDRLAPGRVDVQPIKDLDTDWVTNPANPTTGMVNGVRRTFDLLVDVPGVGQQFAVVARNSDLAVIVGGARQRPGIDYTVIGAELTMTVAPVAGVPFWALWYRPAGGGTGGGIAPPQPPLDGQQSFYGWRPGTGAAWQDARGLALTVANAAARTALRPDVDIFAGTLVLDADTQILWRWNGTAWARYLDSGTFTARLGGRMQSLRSTTALQRPAAASLLPGELWVNQTDRVFGFGDAAGDPIEFLPRVAASAGVDDAGKIPALGASGVLDQSFFLAGMRPYGTVAPGSIEITDWNDAHLNGTAPVRAAAGVPNRPPGADLPYAGQYIAMGNADTGVLTAFSPQGNTVFVRPRNAGAWAAWVQVNSPGLDLASAMLRANNLNDVASKSAGRTNLETMFNPRAVFAGDLNLLDETGLYPLGIGVTNGWVNDGTGAGGEATVGDAVLHIETGGTLAYQLGFNVIPTGPAAKPLRLRFMIGPTTWTPWASVSTSEEVTAQIATAIAALPPGTSVGATPPANPDQGQLWFKTVDPVGLFIWYNDGDSGQWVQTGGGGGGGSDGAAATHVGDAPPPNPAQGQLWFRTIEPVGLFVWFQDADSGQWVSTTVAGGGGAPVDIVQGASGWQVVGDQLICWFTDTTPAGAAQRVTFARAFKDTPSVTVTPISNIGFQRTAHIFAVSSTFVDVVTTNETGAQVAMGFYGIAIGEARDEDKMPKTIGTASGANFATPAEAIAGVRTDRVLSPALVQARQGFLTPPASLIGTTGHTFTDIPAEATEIELLWEALGCAAAASFDVTLNAVAAGYTGIHSAIANAQPVATSESTAAALRSLSFASGLTLIGSLRLVRGAGMWLADGKHRAGVNACTLTGSAPVAGPVTSLRLLTSAAINAGGASLRWRI